jgi:hypothetical protein
MRRFPPPWTVETIPGGLKVCDANGQSLAYVYARENRNDAHLAKVLTEDEARRIASNIAQAGQGGLRASASVGAPFRWLFGSAPNLMAQCLCFRYIAGHALGRPK